MAAAVVLGTPEPRRRWLISAINGQLSTLNLAAAFESRRQKGLTN
jgi:hypothetical protein